MVVLLQYLHQADEMWLGRIKPSGSERFAGRADEVVHASAAPFRRGEAISIDAVVLTAMALEFGVIRKYSKSHRQHL